MADERAPGMPGSDTLSPGQRAAGVRRVRNGAWACALPSGGDRTIRPQRTPHPLRAGGLQRFVLATGAVLNQRLTLPDRYLAARTPFPLITAGNIRTGAG